MLNKNSDVTERRSLAERAFTRQEIFDRLVGHFLIREMDRRARRHLSAGARRMAVFSFDYVSSAININGLYEGDYLELLLGFFKSKYPNIFGGVFVDIGANIGNHSMFFARHFSKVVSFEPNPQTFAVLDINAKRMANLKCFNCGISNKSLTADLMLDPTNTGSASRYDKGSEIIKDIAFRSLEDFRDDVRGVTLIKIDVQGAELEVLEGASGIISEHRPLILLEQVAAEIENNTSPSIQLLRSLGYDRFLVDRKQPEFLSRSPGRLAFLLRSAFHLLAGSSIEIEETSSFDRRNYPMILAIPQAMS